MEEEDVLVRSRLVGLSVCLLRLFVTPVARMSQVTFNPHNQSFLASGSEDGLICYFDTRVSTEEDVSV